MSKRVRHHLTRAQSLANGPVDFDAVSESCRNSRKPSGEINAPIWRGTAGVSADADRSRVRRPKSSLPAAVSAEDVEMDDSVQSDQGSALDWHVLVASFISEILGRSAHFKDELLFSCLEAILSVPTSIAGIALQVPALQAALTRGMPICSIRGSGALR